MHDMAANQRMTYQEIQGRIQKYGLGGVKGWVLVNFPPLPLFSLPPPLPFLSPPLPLEVGPLIQLGSHGER